MTTGAIKVTAIKSRTPSSIVFSVLPSSILPIVTSDPSADLLLRCLLQVISSFSSILRSWILSSACLVVFLVFLSAAHGRAHLDSVMHPHSVISAFSASLHQTTLSSPFSAGKQKSTWASACSCLALPSLLLSRRTHLNSTAS